MIKCDRCLREFKTEGFDMAKHQKTKSCIAKSQTLQVDEKDVRQALLDKYKKLPEIETFLQNQLDDSSLNTLRVTIGLGYYDRNEFVIDFDLVWRHVGFSKKSNALESLRSGEFKSGVDYICKIDGVLNSQHPINKANELGKEAKYYMTTTCAQLFASRARTKEGHRIARDYINIINCMNDYIYLKAELAQRPATAEIERARDKAILSTVHDLYLDDDVIYIIDIGSHEFKHNDAVIEEQLAKLGISDGVSNRVEQHMRTFGHCDIKYIYRTKNRVKVERDYKEANKARRRTLKINGVNHTELFVVDKHYTFESILHEIKNIDAKYTDDDDRAHRRVVELKQLEIEAEEKKYIEKKSEYQLAILHEQRELAKLDFERVIELKRLELEAEEKKHIIELKRVEVEAEERKKQLEHERNIELKRLEMEEEERKKKLEHDRIVELKRLELESDMDKKLEMANIELEKLRLQLQLTQISDKKPRTKTDNIVQPENVEPGIVNTLDPNEWVQRNPPNKQELVTSYRNKYIRSNGEIDKKEFESIIVKSGYKKIRVNSGLIWRKV